MSKLLANQLDLKKESCYLPMKEGTDTRNHLNNLNTFTTVVKSGSYN